MDVCKEINKEHGDEETTTHTNDFITPTPQKNDFITSTPQAKKGKRQTKLATVFMVLYPAKCRP